MIFLNNLTRQLLWLIELRCILVNLRNYIWLVNEYVGVNDVNIFFAFNNFLLGFFKLDRSILSMTFSPGVLGGMESLLLVSSIILGAEVSLFKSHFEINSATKPLYGCTTL
jgi:hypothetical protein